MKFVLKKLVGVYIFMNDAEYVYINKKEKNDKNINEIQAILKYFKLGLKATEDFLQNSGSEINTSKLTVLKYFTTILQFTVLL